jgi:sec-independent protein translocase protein TatA
MLEGISIWQLLILLAIVVVVFGTKRLRNLGGDLGSALKDFSGSIKDADRDEHTTETRERAEEPQVVDQYSATQASPDPAQQRNAHENESAGRD